LTIIELLKTPGAEVNYNDPYSPTVGKGRKYDLNMGSASLDNVRDYEAF
jgi:UDP-N-acetyl-D-glucosamine dehydrogenase